MLLFFVCLQIIGHQLQICGHLSFPGKPKEREPQAALLLAGTRSHGKTVRQKPTGLSSFAYISSSSGYLRRYITFSHITRSRLTSEPQSLAQWLQTSSVNNSELCANSNTKAKRFIAK